MARIERFTSTEPLAVPQAQLVDPSAFRFSTASAEALAQIGGVLTELVKRELDAQDSLAINAAGESRDLAKLQMKQFMLNNPDPATWDEGLSKILSDQGKIYVSQKLSAKAKADEDIEQQAFADELLAETQIASVLRTVENDIFVSGKNLVDKIANDDGTPEAAANIAKQIDLYQAALERDDTKEVADIKMEETLGQAEKQRISILTQQGRFQEAEELALKSKSLTPTERNAQLSIIERTKKARANIIQSASEVAANTAIEDSYAKIIGGDTDIGSMISEIQANPAIGEEESNKAVDKVVTFLSKWNSAEVADVSDDAVYDELTQASEAVERGAMSPAAWEELYADKKGKLDKDDKRTIRSGDIVATKTMQNRTFSDAMIAARPTLVELTESDLGAIKLATRHAELVNDIAAVNMFNIAVKKNQAERWNFGRFRKELRSQIAQNSEWSQKQIFVAQETLTEQLDLPLDKLLREFDAQNPNRAIMKTPPNIDFKDIWSDLSIDDKSKVWELTMRGAPASAILAEVGQ